MEERGAFQEARLFFEVGVESGDGGGLVRRRQDRVGDGDSFDSRVEDGVTVLLVDSAVRDDRHRGRVFEDVEERAQELVALGALGAVKDGADFDKVDQSGVPSFDRGENVVAIGDSHAHQRVFAHDAPRFVRRPRGDDPPVERFAPEARVAGEEEGAIVDRARRVRERDEPLSEERFGLFGASRVGGVEVA